MKLLLALACLAIALPVHAQSIGSNRLHEGQEAVLRRYPSARVIQIADDRGLSMIQTGNDSLVSFCNGVVNEVQETIGHTLHDYAATVVQGENLYGEATVNRVHNTRTTAGEISWADAQWLINNELLYRVIITQTADGEASVIRSFIDPTLCQ